MLLFCHGYFIMYATSCFNHTLIKQGLTLIYSRLLSVAAIAGEGLITLGLIAIA